MLIKKLGIVAGSVLVIMVSGFPALALGETLPVQSTTNQTTGSTSKTTTGAGSQAGTRLADAKLRSCQNREKAVNNILTRVSTRGQNQLTLFSTIAQRVEAFVTTKNLTVVNYAQLVATMNTDKAIATADLAAMKTNVTLDCTSNDPQGKISSFKSSLQKEISDLKTYKTDVKNLIVAVKTAVGSTTSSSSTSTTKTTTGGNQ
jgi:hypothetical protein